MEMDSPTSGRDTLRWASSNNDEGGVDLDLDIEDEDYDCRIKLNIGGQVFETRRNTLQNAPGSMLSAMFGSSRVMAKPDELNQYFFDRDPTHFRLILNYLRTGKIILPESKCHLQELLLEAEFFAVDEIREWVQRALGGLKFEDNFISFSRTAGIWKEGAINTLCQIDYVNKDKKTTYEGFPQKLAIEEFDARPALRMTSLLNNMSRRSICTVELFDADTQRAELVFKILPDVAESAVKDAELDLSSASSAGSVFEFFLWNPSSGEYIGIYLHSDKGENRSLNIACYEGGHKKEKHVENSWDYDQEMRFTIQASGDKTEVRVTAVKSKKKFHVPLSISRIAPFHVVLGQRVGISSLGRTYNDVIVRRVAVLG